MYRICSFVLFFLVIGCHSNHVDVEEGRLLIPDTGFSFELYQRDQIEIPSSNGTVICGIDDITMGQTLLTVSNEDKILISKSMHPKDTLIFEFHAKHYQIICKHLENLLVGNDYGYFLIQSVSTSKENGSEIERIEELLSRIEKSDLIFIRNGTEYSSYDAANHLRSKWKQTSEIVTLNDFIEKIASRSSTTGIPYQVKLKNGVVMNASKWYSMPL